MGLLFSFTSCRCCLALADGCGLWESPSRLLTSSLFWRAQGIGNGGRRPDGIDTHGTQNQNSNHHHHHHHHQLTPEIHLIIELNDDQVPRIIQPPHFRTCTLRIIIIIFSVGIFGGQIPIRRE